MRTHRTSQYYENRVLSASSVTLARIILEHTVVAARLAVTHLNHGEIAERSKAISKAMNLLAEFSAMLNNEADVELCGQLRAVCDYAHQRLFQANVEQSEEKLQEVIRVLSPILEAWQEMERKELTETAEAALSPGAPLAQLV